MSKTLIVAQREYLENLRTKTFWIGIFSLPVLLVLSIFIGRILERSKDVRTYAIVDLSARQWLSQAIESRAATTDLQALARAATDGSEADQDAVRRKVQDWYATLPADHPLRDLERRLAPYVESFDPSQVMGGTEAPELPAEAKAEIFRWAMEASRDPERAAALKSIASGIALARYRSVPLAEFGIEDLDPDDPGAIEQARKRLNEAINADRLFAYFVVPSDPLADGAGEYVSNNLTDNDLRQWFERHATEVVRKRRIDALEGVSEAEARRLLATFAFREQKVSASGETEVVDKSEKASSFAPVIFVYLLWIAVFTAAQMLLTNTVEEKSNRLIEVLLSSVSPLQLMAGKVIGIAATGLTIVVSWVVTALLATRLMPGGGMFGGVDIASIAGDPLYLTSFVAYFLAGYLLFAAILVALGSVCNSLKEAQNLMQPVFILLIVPLIAMVFVVQDPNGTVATVLTYVPLYTPFLMMNRAGGPPPAWEYVATTVLILVSLVIAFWGAAKIFRVGILMTGKPPKITEILRWLRAPVGAVHVHAEPKREA
jgi:ABC-2 type transport system permease protein